MEQNPLQPEQSAEAQDGPLKKVEESRDALVDMKKKLEAMGEGIADASKLDTLMRVVEKYPDRGISDDISAYFRNYDKPFYSKDAVDQLLNKAELLLGPEKMEKLKNGG